MSIIPNEERLNALSEHKPPEQPAGKTLTIRLNRETIFTGVLVALIVATGVQSYQIGKLKEAEASSPTPTTSVSSAPQAAAGTTGSSGSALQGIPSQVGGC